MNWWFDIWHWLQEILGVNNSIPGHTPRWYNFQSAGLVLTWVLGLSVLYWHHNCRQHRCPRWARHTTAAGQKVCKTHHPDMGKGYKITAQHIKKAHKEAL